MGFAIVQGEDLRTITAKGTEGSVLKIGGTTWADCGSKSTCGILSTDQKRSNFLTSYVKLAQMEPENFIKELAKRGCVNLGAFLSRFP